MTPDQQVLRWLSFVAIKEIIFEITNLKIKKSLGVG